jgi:hypothetical protein
MVQGLWTANEIGMNSFHPFIILVGAFRSTPIHSKACIELHNDNDTNEMSY